MRFQVPIVLSSRFGSEASTPTAGGGGVGLGVEVQEMGVDWTTEGSDVQSTHKHPHILSRYHSVEQSHCAAPCFPRLQEARVTRESNHSDIRRNRCRSHKAHFRHPARSLRASEN